MQANSTQSLAPCERLIRLPEVESKTGLKKSSLYRLIKEEQFPAPIKLGTRASAWAVSAVDAWIVARIRGQQ